MTLTVALAQVNPRVGDLSGNAAMIRNFSKKASELGASLVVFPEMGLTGYPIEDLSLRKSFQQASKKALSPSTSNEQLSVPGTKYLYSSKTP